MNIYPMDEAGMKLPRGKEFTLYDFNMGTKFQVKGLMNHEGSVLFSEYCTIFQSVDIITTATGNRPNSICSYDCSRDYIIYKFLQDEIARVPIESGYHHIHAYRKNMNNNNTKDSVIIYFIISEILDVKEDSVIMRITHKFNNANLNSIPVKFKQAIGYIVDSMIDNSYYEGSITPYSVNDKKIYDVRLFIRDSAGDFISYRNDGAKYILHRESMINNNRHRLVHTDQVGKFIKISYDKKYKDSNKIIVDGWEIQMLSQIDLDLSINIFIQHYGKFSLEDIKKVKTHSGYSFYAMVNAISNEVKALYNSWGGFPTITLNDKEKTFILAVEEAAVSKE